MMLATCRFFCSVLQCVAVCSSVLQCVAVCCSVLQCVAECFSVLQSVADGAGDMQVYFILCIALYCGVLPCFVVCCKTHCNTTTHLQCVVVYCCVSLEFSVL